VLLYMNPSANRVFIPPQRFGRAFGNHNAVQIPVALFQKTAGQEVFFQRFEIFGTRPAQIDERLALRPVQPLDSFDPRFPFQRHGASEARAFDARNGAQIREDGIVERGAARIRVVGRRRQPNLCNRDLLRLKSFVLIEQIEQAFGEDAGDEQQRGAAENLDADEPAAQPATLAAARSAAAILLQGRLRIGAERPHRGKQTGQDAGCQRKRDRKEQHGSIETDLRETGQVNGRVAV
jgi:hypothetical protein